MTFPITHTAPIMDVSWRDDSVMATCSHDHTLAVYNIHESRPLHRLRVCGVHGGIDVHAPLRTTFHTQPPRVIPAVSTVYDGAAMVACWLVDLMTPRCVYGRGTHSSTPSRATHVRCTALRGYQPVP